MIVDTGYHVPVKPDTLVTHRLITDSTGRLLIFFQTDYRSLSFGASVNGGHTWTAAQDIFPGIYGPFAAAAGAGGSIYIAVRTMYPSNISLVAWDGRSWSDHIIRPAVAGQAVLSPPLLVKSENSNLHLIYAARRHHGNWQISHSVLDAGAHILSRCDLPAVNAVRTGIPHRFDFVNDLLFWSGDMINDGENNLHMVCRVFSGDCYHLFYSCRGGDSGKWGDFIPLTKTTRHRGHPRLITGSDKKTVHVLFSEEEDHAVRLACITRSPDGNWGAPRIIASGLKKDILPETVCTGASPEAYWVSSEGVCQCYLESRNTPQNVLAGEITSISAVSVEDKVFLSFTGTGNFRGKVLFYTRG